MLQTIPFNRLLKLELPLLTNRIIEIVAKNNPEALKIKESFDLLEKLIPQLIKLEKRHGPHPITEKLNTLRKSRLKYALLITTQLSVYILDDEMDLHVAAEVVQPLVQRFLIGLRRNNDDIITENVDQFLLNIYENETIRAAISTLDLFKYIKKLQSVNTIIKEEWKNRSNSISKRQNEYPTHLRKPIYDAIRNLISQVNQAQFHYPELDYAPLINELNNVLSFYGGKINSRNSYNKRRKAGTIIEKPVIVNDNVDLDVESIGFTVEHDSHIEQSDLSTTEDTRMFFKINEGKTAAMVSSTMRLRKIPKET